MIFPCSNEAITLIASDDFVNRCILTAAGDPAIHNNLDCTQAVVSSDRKSLRLDGLGRRTHPPTCSVSPTISPNPKKKKLKTGQKQIFKA